jgi:dihydropyrimidine dehydrogenase (NAD+) subunit PreT
MKLCDEDRNFHCFDLQCYLREVMQFPSKAWFFTSSDYPLTTASSGEPRRNIHVNQIDVSSKIAVKQGVSLKPSQGYLEETVPPLTPFTAMEEASRCLLCLDAPCSTACPAGTDPGGFIRAIRFRNFKGAAEIIRKNNILGGVCARVCPFEKTCEGACVKTGIDKPIQIGRLQRFATDYEKATGFQVLEPVKPGKVKVAMIGSGPASLAAAAAMALEGYAVTVFEKREKPGGVLAYGIVPARLPIYVTEEEIDYVRQLGVEFACNTEVGKDITLDDLRKQGFKAFLVGTGMQRPIRLDVPGNGLEGVTTAMEYLSRARNARGAVSPGSHVVVIGCGDVAMDCAITARLLKADKVTVLYRRTREEAPANRAEISYCESLGINFLFTFTPEEFIGEGGKVTAVKGVGSRDASFVQLQADTVVYAIGHRPENLSELLPGVAMDDKYYILSKGDGRTSAEDIFTAGDIDLNTNKTVVDAVAAGKAAAVSMQAYLEGKVKVKEKEKEKEDK